MDKIKSRVDNDEQNEELRDSVGAKYLKVVNSVSFDDLAICTVDYSYREHDRC